MSETTKHPQGLMVLFFTEMWERFSYYGMRALLVLYLTAQLIHGGFGMNRTEALEIYALFTGLVYLTPILGGFFADKIIGQRQAIFVGAITMGLGQCLLAYSQFAGDIALRTHWFNFGLGLLIIGNGFFKPNISTIVGSLYKDNDPRKDSGFTIFYMGINLGAFLSPLIAGYLGETIGWAWGFGSAAVGMLVGTLWFLFQSHKLDMVGFAPNADLNRPRAVLNAKEWINVAIWTASTVITIYAITVYLSDITATAKNTILYSFVLIVITGLFVVIGMNTKGKSQWSKVSAVLIFCLFNIIFWAGFEQAGGTMNLFAEHNTFRQINFIIKEIPASFFQAINPLAIFAIAPLFSIMWVWLASKGKNPNTPVKFGLGLLLLGLGFTIMLFASLKANNGTLVGPLWLVSVFLIHTLGELCLSPIGLSMITNMAPPKTTSIMMGLWFGSNAIANYLAGTLESILHTHMPNMNIFMFISIMSVGAGVLMILISPLVNRLMK